MSPKSSHVKKICTAIQNCRRLRFWYDGGSREVEPMICGATADQSELLSGYQISGYSQTGDLPGWRAFTLEKIQDLVVTSIPCDPPPPDYNPDDPHFDEIYCRREID